MRKQNKNKANTVIRAICFWSRKKLFSKTTIIHKIFETSSSFHVKQQKTGMI